MVGLSQAVQIARKGFFTGQNVRGGKTGHPFGADRLHNYLPGLVQLFKERLNFTEDCFGLLSVGLDQSPLAVVVDPGIIVGDFAAGFKIKAATQLYEDSECFVDMGHTAWNVLRFEAVPGRRNRLYGETVKNLHQTLGTGVQDFVIDVDVSGSVAHKEMEMDGPCGLPFTKVSQSGFGEISHFLRYF